MDGYSSPISMQFLEYAIKNRILVMKCPSHSTHSLQPLDVSIFGPLSTAYLSELHVQQQRSQGLLPVKKPDFYRLFKQAWASAASKSNIKAAFEATGIWPQDRTVVTKKFEYTTPPNQIDPVNVSHLSPADWRRTEQLLQQLVVDQTDERFKKLERAIHHASTETKLLRYENRGLLASLDTHNKCTNHSRRLLVTGSKKQFTDAAFYSPRRLEAARLKIVKKDKAKAAQKAANHTKKELTQAKKALDQKHQEEKRKAAKRQREVKEAQKAEREAEKQRRREERDCQKALKTSQKGKRKALEALPKPKKKQKLSGGGSVGGSMGSVAKRAATQQPSRLTKSGRTSALPSRFR
jgi:hypothetical protein